MAINAFIDSAKVIAKGQATIPKDVREELRIKSKAFRQSILSVAKMPFLV